MDDVAALVSIIAIVCIVCNLLLSHNKDHHKQDSWEMRIIGRISYKNCKGRKTRGPVCLLAAFVTPCVVLSGLYLGVVPHPKLHHN